MSCNGVFIRSHRPIGVHVHCYIFRAVHVTPAWIPVAILQLGARMRLNRIVTITRRVYGFVAERLRRRKNRKQIPRNQNRLFLFENCHVQTRGPRGRRITCIIIVRSSRSRAIPSTASGQHPGKTRSCPQRSAACTVNLTMCSQYTNCDMHTSGSCEIRAVAYLRGGESRSTGPPQKPKI